MISKKMGLLWASAVLFLTSMSWGDITATGKCGSSSSDDCRVNRMMLRMGSSSEYKNFNYGGNSWGWAIAKDTSGNFHDLQEYGDTGDYGYVYLAFAVTSVLHGGGDGTGYTETSMPITDIIIENYPTYAPETVVIGGRLYKKLHIENNYDSPLNKDKDRSYYGLWIYYTQDYYDGRAIYDIKVGKANKNDASQKPLPNALTGYEIVTNGSRDAQSLIAAGFSTYHKYNYLYVKKGAMTMSARPTASNLVFEYSPNGGSFYGKTTNASHYKIGNGYEDGLWKFLTDFTTLEPGTYQLYLKNKSRDIDDNSSASVAGPFTMTVNKISAITDAGKIYIYGPEYSGQKLSVTWTDYCVAPGTFSASKTTPPSDAKFYYSSYSTGPWTLFDVNTKWFNAGTYYVRAEKPANKYCEKIEIAPKKFEVKKSKIIVVKNNGQSDDVIEQNYNTSITYKLPTLTKTGYTHTGWSGLEEWNGKLPTTMPAGVLTINAQWKINSYTLTLYPNNPNSGNVYTSRICSNLENESCYSGIFTGSSTSYNYNASISYPTLYKIGYTHTGWSPEKPSYMPAKNLTLSAQWKINQYTLTFDSDGGSEVAPITQNYGTAVTKPSNPTRDGFSFAGWDPQIPTTMPAANKTYKAKWDTAYVTITYEDGYSGKVLKTISEKYKRSLSSFNPPESPTRTGYTFAGWDNALPSTMPAKNMTIKAMWNIDYFEVTLQRWLELAEPVTDVNGTYVYGTQMKLRLQKGYKMITENVLRWASAEGGDYPVACEFDADGVCTVTIDRNGKIRALYPTEDFGSIQITPSRSEAVFNYDTSVTSMITEPIEVRSVVNIKEYTPNFAEVVMLPFDIDLAYVRGGIFCKFLGMEKSGFNYTARLMFMSTELKANTPYLYVPIWTTMRFNLPYEETVAIKTAQNPEVRQGDWVFRGNYNEINWEDTEIENAYVFKGKDSDADGVNGSFVKATSGTLHSMSGYLIQEKQAASAVRGVNGKAAQKTMSIEELPDEIGIRIEYENGKTTALGTLNTRTGEMKIDRWFDLQGRLLKGKPTIKGVYYNNGKKVIVK